MRKFIVKESDAEGEPIIAEGEARFWCPDEELVPAGYEIDIVQNSPKLKTIFVLKKEG